MSRAEPSEPLGLSIKDKLVVLATVVEVFEELERKVFGEAVRCIVLRMFSREMPLRS